MAELQDWSTGADTRAKALNNCACSIASQLDSESGKGGEANGNAPRPEQDPAPQVFPHRGDGWMGL